MQAPRYTNVHIRQFVIIRCFNTQNAVIFLEISSAILNDVICDREKIWKRGNQRNVEENISNVVITPAPTCWWPSTVICRGICTRLFLDFNWIPERPSRACYDDWSAYRQSLSGSAPVEELERTIRPKVSTSHRMSNGLLNMNMYMNRMHTLSSIITPWHENVFRITGLFYGIHLTKSR